ncbi:hypothetical protein [Streptomyces sp. NPDC001389]|uniref:hypothetical protein n=1 Tax=Streptomyces sp. NPDC001389 TaxID=3364569 RepID=UPI00368DF5E1
MSRTRPKPLTAIEQVPGQLDLFDAEEHATGPATTAGPAPAADTTPTADEAPRTEP